MGSGDRNDSGPNIAPGDGAKRQAPATPTLPWHLKPRREKEALLRATLARVGALGWKAVAHELGCSVTTARTLGASLGLSTVDVRQASAAAVTQVLPPAPEEGATHLGWSVLRLFDTVVPYLRKAREGEGDLRRTWTAWRTFLASAFGSRLEDLELDQSRPQNEIDSRKSREGSFVDAVTFPPYPGVDAKDVERGAASLPPGSTALQIFQRCTGRSNWPSKQFSQVSLIVGRRGGKSQITAIIGVFLAVCREYQLNLGTRGMVMILARDREQARVIREYMIAILKTPPLAPFLKGEPTKQLIELTNGISIEVRAVSMGGVQGYTVVAALLDEVAYWPTDESSVKQDKEVLRAIRPTMLGVAGRSDAFPDQVFGPMVVLLSSPYAKRGELYESYANAWGKDEDGYELVWNADTLSMRPGDPNEQIQAQLLDHIRREYLKDPENARAVYGAFFRTDLETIITRNALDAVVVPSRILLQPQTDKFLYRAFVDPSGGSADSYTMAIAHTEVRDVNGEAREVEVVDLVAEVRPPFNPEEVTTKELVPILRTYGIALVTGDAYAGEWPREAFRKNGVDYEVSERPKAKLYLETVAKINSRACELPENERMISQLTNLERRVGRTGRDTIDHPAGSHDDVANAVAGALVTVTEEIFRDVVW